MVGGSLRSTAQVNMESSVLVNKEGKAKGGDSVRSAGQVSMDDTLSKYNKLNLPVF